MSEFNDVLQSGMAKFKIILTEKQLWQFNEYYKLLTLWNNKMNLTAITEPTEVAIKHFVDSCSILNYINVKENAKVIDIGTGAGFPGIPLKIVRDDINLTLLDSLNKRLLFLNEAAKEIGITANTIHGRAEDYGKDITYREKFDMAVSRAVAPLNVLSEYCIPFVKKGGIFVSMKGPNIQEEVNAGKSSIKLLGGKINNVKQFSLGDNSRSIIIVEKVNNTPAAYPRHGSKISKKPL